MENIFQGTTICESDQIIHSLLPKNGDGGGCFSSTPPSNCFQCYKIMTNIAEFDVDFCSQRTRASYWRTRRLWIIRSFTATRPSAKPPATTGNYKLTNNKQQVTFTNNVHCIQRKQNKGHFQPTLSQ